MSDFTIKDSGEREQQGEMVRDTEDGKLDYSNLFLWYEPMGTRYAAHMTAGRKKYPDPKPGVPNWTLTPITEEQMQRFMRSADRHYKQWRRGDTDEDHAAAVLFNINGAEYVRERLDRDDSDSGGSDQEMGVDSYSDYLALSGLDDATISVAKRALAEYEARRERESC